MVQNWRRGHVYRVLTDANYRRRQRFKSRTSSARSRLVRPGARCQSRAKSAHAGPLEVHHVGGDLTGRRGFKVFCRRHNRKAAGIKSSRGRVPRP